MFHFKHFSIRHDRCAVKVGTDGLLLGGWTDFASAKRILDIGTGSGVLALIAAQRNSTAMVDAVELDDAAAGQAAENFAASPWKDRLRAHRMDVRRMKATEPFDLIISNPPFFSGEMGSPDQRTGLAKHGAELTFNELIDAIGKLLAPDGRASLIVPNNREQELVAEADRIGLRPSRRCVVHYLAGRPPKRVMLELRKNAVDRTEEEIVVADERGVVTAQYGNLIQDLLMGS